MIGTAIYSVLGRRLWDSRGRPTVEAEVRLADGSVGRAMAPAGASVGSGEALDLRDGTAFLDGMDVHRAIANIDGDIAVALRGLDAADQETVDRRMGELDGTPNMARLGGNATVAVSIAVAQAAAASGGLPLWHHLLGADDEVPLPLPEIQIFGGGVHAGRRVDVQDYMVVCPGADSFAQALDWTAEVYLAAGRLMAAAGRLCGVADEGGWWPAFDDNEQPLEMLVRAIEQAGYEPGRQVAIALDVAATQLRRDGGYRLSSEGRDLDSDGLAETILRWIERYPIVSVEDPLAEDDIAGLARFTGAVADRVQVVADDAAVTDAARVRALRASGACTALLVKPNQAGTLTAALEALIAARESGWGAVASARSGETEDVSIAHLAVGWGVRQLKVGAFARSERMAKWNEMLRIEQAAGSRARFAGGAVYPGRDA